VSNISDEDFEKNIDKVFITKLKERRLLDEDLFETVEEVFDRATVQAVLQLMRRKTLAELKGVVSTGKESRVYWGKSFKGEDLAVKIYLTSSSEFRKGMVKYIKGDPRFGDNIPKSTRKLVIMWAKKEFKNYKALFDAGVSVPKPIDQYENVLVMEFIGREGVRAPLLKEITLTYEEYVKLFVNLIEDVKKAYVKANLVHGDLSEFNVMIFEDRHYIIDVSQAVPLTHPNSHELLIRDLRNIHRYFSKEVGLKIPSVDVLYKYVTNELSELPGVPQPLNHS